MSGIPIAVSPDKLLAVPGRTIYAIEYAEQPKPKGGVSGENGRDEGGVGGSERVKGEKGKKVGKGEG